MAIPLSKPLTTRAQHLAKLLSASQLPAATLQGIQEALPKLNLRQIDLLIDALSREQREWDRLEEMLFDAERDTEARLSTVRDQQAGRARAIVDQVADEAEREEAERIRRHLNGAS